MDPLAESMKALAAECVELSRESDRGVILVGAAMLDARVERAIIARLRDDPKLASQLLEPDRPLGSFGAKIKLAYLLGILSADERRELDLVRRIRNKAAHEATAASFEHFADQVRALTARMPEDTGLRALGERLSTRQRFVAMVSGLAWEIERAAATTERLEEVARPVPPMTISFLLDMIFRALPVFWDHRDTFIGGVRLDDVPMEDFVKTVLMAFDHDRPVEGYADGVTPALIRLHADTIASLAHAHQEAGQAADLARQEALDAIEHGHPGLPEERIAALSAERNRWRPAGVALDRARNALHDWVQGLEDACASRATADEAENAASRLAGLAHASLRRYEEAVDVLSSIGIEAPAPPTAARVFELPAALQRGEPPGG